MSFTPKTSHVDRCPLLPDSSAALTGFAVSFSVAGVETAI